MPATGIRSSSCIWVRNKRFFRPKIDMVSYRKNALTIHHTTNNQTIRDGELLLLDGGGEWKYV